MTQTISGLLLGTLSILASGYIVYGALLCRRFWPRTAGYAPYFRIIVAGLLLTIPVTAGIWWMYCGAVQYAPVAAFLLALVLRAIAGGVVWLGSRLNPRWRCELNLSNLNDKGLDQLVLEKLYNGEMIMVTLKSGKVYMGWPLEAADYDEGKWLRLVPLFSGYRDEKSEVRVTVDYSKVFPVGTSESVPMLAVENSDTIDGSAKPFERPLMLLAVDSIYTVQPFDQEIFAKFAGD